MVVQGQMILSVIWFNNQYFYRIIKSEQKLHYLSKVSDIITNIIHSHFSILVNSQCSYENLGIIFNFSGVLGQSIISPNQILYHQSYSHYPMSHTSNSPKNSNTERLIFPVKGDSHLYQGVGRKHFSIPDDSINDINTPSRQLFPYVEPPKVNKMLNKKHNNFDKSESLKMYVGLPSQEHKNKIKGINNKIRNFSSIDDLDRGKQWYEKHDSLSILSQKADTPVTTNNPETFGMASRQINRPRFRRNKESSYRMGEDTNIFGNTQKLYDLLHNKRDHKQKPGNYMKMPNYECSPRRMNPSHIYSVL